MAVNNDKLYELLDRTRIELKGDIVRVESKFDNLQSVTIARLEDAVNELKIKEATFATKMAVLGFIASSVIGALVTGLAYKVFGGH